MLIFVIKFFCFLTTEASQNDESVTKKVKKEVKISKKEGKSDDDQKEEKGDIFVLQHHFSSFVNNCASSCY